MKIFIFMACMAWLAPTLAAKSIACPLDPLLTLPGNWNMSVDQFEKHFSSNGNKLYRWLTKDKSRAKISRKLYRNAEINLTLYGESVPAQEAIVDFADGQLNLISISIYNRADSGNMTAAQLEKHFKTIGKNMGESLNARPRRRDADSKSGLLTEGYSWYSRQNGIALLEHNEGALKDGAQEFLRLRIARPNASGSLASSMKHSRGGAATRLSDLPRNVVKTDEGDVYINNLPMVDQGDKGYCVVASAQRLFEYYGIGADMHQIAQIAGSDPARGTNTLIMAKELDKIDYRFKTRLVIIGMGQPLTEVSKKRDQYFVGDSVDERQFIKAVQRHIDKGLPLLWSLELGRFPERPQLNPQTAGGHMRMIIGYNEKTQDIIFSDSWGAGHEAKRMKMSHAYQASHGLFVLKPTVH
ncbi:MAG: C39 family peptidase [Verrucomicrobiae bacterium]|nr:C39 family peptidase [Verrucomicrobiae bacterium]NNJ43512.1 hypothetical protein [Akkermansiaceae bacterium]